MTDEKLVFSDSQEVLTSADSTNTLDQGALTDDRGVALSEFGPEGGQVRLVVTIPLAYAGGTSVAFKLQHSANDSTYVDTYLVQAAVAVATLVLGYEVMNIPIPPGLRRYLKMVYTVAGTPTAGKIDARLRCGMTS